MSNVQHEQAILNSMIAAKTLSVNPTNGDYYIALSPKAVELFPSKVEGYNYLKQFATFGGRVVTDKKHTIVATGAIVDSVSLPNPDFKPEWMTLAGL